MFLIALKYMLGDIQKGRPADPVGGGVFGIRTFNCYSIVILLFYTDAGGEGGLEILVLSGRPLWMTP